MAKLDELRKRFGTKAAPDPRKDLIEELSKTEPVEPCMCPHTVASHIKTRGCTGDYGKCSCRWYPGATVSARTDADPKCSLCGDAEEIRDYRGGRVPCPGCVGKRQQIIVTSEVSGGLSAERIAEMIEKTKGYKPLILDEAEFLKGASAETIAVDDIGHDMCRCGHWDVDHHWYVDDDVRGACNVADCGCEHQDIAPRCEHCKGRGLIPAIPKDEGEVGCYKCDGKGFTGIHPMPKAPPKVEIDWEAVAALAPKPKTWTAVGEECDRCSHPAGRHGVGSTKDCYVLGCRCPAFVPAPAAVAPGFKKTSEFAREVIAKGLVDCPTCSGKGKVTDYRRALPRGTCPDCGGDGRMKLGKTPMPTSGMFMSPGERAELFSSGMDGFCKCHLRGGRDECPVHKNSLSVEPPCGLCLGAKVDPRVKKAMPCPSCSAK